MIAYESGGWRGPRHNDYRGRRGDISILITTLYYFNNHFGGALLN